MPEPTQKIVVYFLGIALLLCLLAAAAAMLMKLEIPAMLGLIATGCLTGLTAIYQHSPKGASTGDVAGDVNVTTPSDTTRAPIKDFSQPGPVRSDTEVKP